MMIKDLLTQLVHKAVSKIFPDSEVEIQISNSKRPDLADYTTSLAMQLFAAQFKVDDDKDMKPKFKNPREVAEAMMAEMNELLAANVIDGLSDKDVNLAMAGPGFINFKLTKFYLINNLNKQVWSDFSAFKKANRGQKIIVEYSSPNIAKPFTIGHLRSTIIGDALANLHQKVGWEVFRDNHLGDWGTQFGKQIYALKAWGDEKQILKSENPVKELVKLYVKFHEEAEKDEDLNDQARAWFKKLEDGDKEAKRVWQFCIDASWQEFDRIYQRLGISFTENDGRGYGESYFEDKMEPIIAELKDKKMLTDSEGAQLIFYPEEKFPPLMVLKKDGATLYATRDFATDKFRLEHYGPDVVVLNEIGQEQSLYMKQIYEAEYMMGWYKPGQRIHVGHGLYRFKDGKMSTRKGNVIWLEDIFKEAFDKVKAQAKDDLDDEIIWKIAIGALKWSDLKRDPLKDIVFDWDEILNLEGNSGPYVQYMFVRCQSVMNKALEQGLKITKEKIPTDAKLHKSEVALLKALSVFPVQVAKAAEDKSPYLVAQYLFELAQLFSSFYTQCPILQAEDKGEQHRRLLLIQATAQVLKDGLALLGIETVEKM